MQLQQDLITYLRILVAFFREEPVILLDKVLNYLALVWHVIDHVGHVVLRRSDKRGTKHDCQVTRLHLRRRCYRDTEMRVFYWINNRQI